MLLFSGLLPSPKSSLPTYETYLASSACQPLHWPLSCVDSNYILVHQRSQIVLNNISLSKPPSCEYCRPCLQMINQRPFQPLPSATHSTTSGLFTHGPKDCRCYISDHSTTDQERSRLSQTKVFESVWKEVHKIPRERLNHKQSGMFVPHHFISSRLNSVHRWHKALSCRNHLGTNRHDRVSVQHLLRKRSYNKRQPIEALSIILALNNLSVIWKHRTRFLHLGRACMGPPPAALPCWPWPQGASCSLHSSTPVAAHCSCVYIPHIPPPNHAGIPSSSSLASTNFPNKDASSRSPVPFVVHLTHLFFPLRICPPEGYRRIAKICTLRIPHTPALVVRPDIPNVLERNWLHLKHKTYLSVPLLHTMLSVLMHDFSSSGFFEKVWYHCPDSVIVQNIWPCPLASKHLLTGAL